MVTGEDGGQIQEETHHRLPGQGQIPEEAHKAARQEHDHPAQQGGPGQSPGLDPDHQGPQGGRHQKHPGSPSRGTPGQQNRGHGLVGLIQNPGGAVPVPDEGQKQQQGRPDEDSQPHLAEHPVHRGEYDPILPGAVARRPQKEQQQKGCRPQEHQGQPPVQGAVGGVSVAQGQQAAEFILDHHQFRLEHAVAQDGVALAVLRRYRSAGAVRGSHGGSPRFRLGRKVHLAAVDRQHPVVDAGDLSLKGLA